MCCSLRAIVGFGIVLAVLDMMQGLSSMVWYGYRFLWRYWHLCPTNQDLQVCHEEIYHHDQYYKLRNFIGLGEGGITILFVIVYIISLVKHKPWLMWLWILKALGVLGVNVSFISMWTIRQGNVEDRRISRQDYDDQYLWIAIGLTAAECAILLLFCLLGGMFTYKVCEERRRSRRSLNRLHKSGRRGRATAPPLDYDDESSIVRGNIENHFLNHGLTDSTNKLPLPGSNCSMDEVGQASTLRQPTEV